jgi:UDP-N-acetylmuramate-alanine ligase
MKINIILLAICATIMVACNSKNDTRSFIPGMYVNHAKGEYSIASDTLVIEASESNNYFIHRKTGFQLIRNGKTGKHEHETEEWKAVYDEGTKTLTETQKGKLITFLPDSGKLSVGKREYNKIN